MSEYIKSCPNCNLQISYSTKTILNRSIKGNWVCNKCSTTHQKKIYSDEIINKILDLYRNNISFSKISLILKIKRDNVKNILIEKGMWIENRDEIKKHFESDDIKNIIEMYQDNMSAQKIGEKYNVSKGPILKILRENDILRKGTSNGKKIELTKCQKDKIKILYIDEYKNTQEIANILNLSKPFVEKYLSNSTYRRNKSEGNSIGLVFRYRGMKYNEYLKNIDEIEKYKNDVYKITRQQPIHELLNYDKRGNSGVKNAYHLDHKFSISEGFNNKIPPEIIGDIKNLEFIPWEENIKKRTNCSITINELIN